jgi:hypothetical protein
MHAAYCSARSSPIRLDARPRAHARRALPVVAPATERLANADRRPGSILARLSGVEIIQVDEITRTPGGPLHRAKVLKRAYRDRDAGHLDIYCTGSKLGIGQNAVETLDHIQISEPCSDQRSLAAAQQRCDGTLGAEQRLPQLDVTTELNRDAGKGVEVLWRRVGNDVAVLGSPHNAPRPQRQAANDDEANIRLNEPGEKLIEGWCAQRARCAESRSSCSMRVSAIVSLRFTTSGRCPSARSRSRRTRSPSGSCGCCWDCSDIEPKHYRAPSPKEKHEEQHARGMSAPRLRKRGIRDDPRISVGADPKAP